MIQLRPSLLLLMYMDKLTAEVSLPDISTLPCSQVMTDYCLLDSENCDEHGRYTQFAHTSYQDFLIRWTPVKLSRLDLTGTSWTLTWR